MTSDERPAPRVGQKFDLLRSLLREMFQLDRGDLDFGLYRIMNLKSEEITKFLDEDLLPRVKENIRMTSEEDLKLLEEEIKKFESQAFLMGFEPEASDKYQDLKKRYREALKDVEVEADVYNLLTNFFSRYYVEGDFISQRRYTGGGRSAYLIPYDGEEVKLHWANADQYYIKTTENYASYSFTVGSKADRRISFEIVKADNEKDNIKEANNKQRRFVLARDRRAVDISNGQLVVRFEHRPITAGEKKRWPGNSTTQQCRINKETEKRILDKVDSNWHIPLTALDPTDANEKRTSLGKHIDRYTSKNSFDYFIHKDLKGFLSRELDMFLNSEVLKPADLEMGDASRLDRALARVRAVRRIGTKIIDFLAQLENFQKQLWLKKKFVLDTQWCVTLDKVPEQLLPEIAANKAQCEEWIGLFAVDEIEGDTTNGNTTWSNPPSIEFLMAHPHLVVDTSYFDQEFKTCLLSSLSEAGSLEDQMDGLLVHSENFQALNLLAKSYQDRINCIYIDPPYNSGTDKTFIYKDRYRHSSWISMMRDRLDLGKMIAKPSACLFVSTDDGEYANLRLLLDNLWGSDNFIADVIWNSRRSVSSDAVISTATNHTTFYVVDRPIFELRKDQFRLPTRDDGFSNPDNDRKGPWKLDPMDAPNIRQNLTYPITNPVTGQEHWPPAGRHWRFEQVQTEAFLQEGRIIFGRGGKAKPAYKRYLVEAQSRGKTPTTLWDDVCTTTEATKYLQNAFGKLLSPSEIDRIKPKPVELLERIALLSIRSEDYLLDFFAGSGTSAHAIINLNRKDNGNRKYMMVEVGGHFDSVMVPRLKKAIYSTDWKQGKPVLCQGISHIFKKIRLESYEDTLDSLEVCSPSKDMKTLLKENTKINEDYTLKHLLNSGRCFFNVEEFSDPFKYSIDVVQNGERSRSFVDLPETFNYLIGLNVESYQRVDDVLVITGIKATGERCLILWRNLNDIGYSELEGWFNSYRDKFAKDIDVIYVNGDHTLNAIRRPDESWIAESIEPIFEDAMFNASGV